MRLPLYQVDAFADKPFAGNPAAVCPLERWISDELMQAIAAENNLAETAFFVPEGAGYGLRWFTPENEIDLCGHATLASAYVVFRYLQPQKPSVSFRTVKSGVLNVTRDGEVLSLDFPSWPAEPCAAPDELVAALGRKPVALLARRDYMAVYEAVEDVLALRPDFAALGRLGRAVIVTAPGRDGIDFVSRFFAPCHGVDEDSVTGSSHCSLIPYWAERLGKTKLQARQVSRRGGVLSCSLNGDRVGIGGRAALYMTGTIEL